eukprot:7096388-Pyramimonas_sp.AAC.1
MERSNNRALCSSKGSERGHHVRPTLPVGFLRAGPLQASCLVIGPGNPRTGIRAKLNKICMHGSR